MKSISVQTSSNKAAKAVIARIYKKYDVLYTDNDLDCVTGSSLTAEVCLDDGHENVHPAEQRQYKTTVRIKSNYYSDATLEKIANEAKGRGTVVIKEIDPFS